MQRDVRTCLECNGRGCDECDWTGLEQESTDRDESKRNTAPADRYYQFMNKPKHKRSWVGSRKLTPIM